MPRYNYRCKNVLCLRAELYVFRIAQQPAELRCPHCLEGVMKQVFGVPYLTTRPHAFREDNSLRAAYGARDQKEFHAMIDADEKAYAKNHEDKTATIDKGPDPYAGQPDFFDYAAAGYEMPTVKELVDGGVLK